MSKFSRLIPILAVIAAFSPLAALAATDGSAKNQAYVASVPAASQFAANAKAGTGDGPAPQAETPMG